MSITKRVAILGATGVVGQRFIQLLQRHPWFQIVGLAASEKSAGKTFQEACSWKLPTPMPSNLRSTVVRPCRPSDLRDLKPDLVFSALDSNVAGEIEAEFANSRIPVFSNASNYRMASDVPILIPDVNPDHIHSVKRQKTFSSGGFIVTNANCSTTGLTIALAPLKAAFGLKQLHVVTLQAASGAGYPGVPSLDIIDNIVPYIGKEESKLETETLKIFGSSSEQGFRFLEDLTVSAACNRVPVIDGHTACISVKLKTPNVTPEKALETLSNYRSQVQELKLPSAPKSPLNVFPSSVHDRPQPRLDRGVGEGYTVSVGRVRKCNLLDLKLIALSHNTVIGAAGGSILNAELAVAHKYV